MVVNVVYTVILLDTMASSLTDACTWSGVVLLVIASCVLRTRGQPSSGVTTSTAAPSLLRLLCTSNPCRNGECYLVGTSRRCVCGQIYRGDECETVNLDQVKYALIGSMVIFKWPRPPRLKGYSFVYYELSNSDDVLYKRRIDMKDNEHSVLVGNLKGGKTRYRICIEDEYIADRAMVSNSKQLLTNCLDVTTQPDYHTLVGWMLAFLLAGVCVLLMYSQRQKIEILYFSRPYVPQMEPNPQSGSSQSQSRSQSQSSISKQNIPNSIEKEV